MRGKGAWLRELGCRHVLVLLGFFGNFFSYTMRLTMTMALVQMTSEKGENVANNSTNRTPECPLPAGVDTSDSQSTTYGEVFDWTTEQQGQIQGSFFYGYIFTQIPSGYLSGYYGAKLLYGLGIGFTAFFVLLSPAAARHSIGALIAIRVLMGLAQGISIPLLNTMFGRWAPPAERTKLLAITSAGMQLGTVVAFPICGALGEAYGWPSMFYCFGTLGLLFCIPWFLFAYDSPEEHPKISAEEKSYIISSIGAPAMGAQPSPVPWRSIMKSMPFWALIVSCPLNDWGFYTLLSDVPLYLKGVMHFTLQQNANFSGIPYLVMWFVVMFFSPVADWVIYKGYTSITAERKITTALGTIIPGLLLIGIPWAGCSQTTVLTLLTLSTGFTGFSSLGFRVNFNDISPSHAGFLYAIGNTVSTVTGFLGPVVTGILTSGPNGHSTANWANVFYIAAALYFLGAIIYCIFGSGDLQDWDNKEKNFNKNRVAPEVVSGEPDTKDGVEVVQPGKRKSSIPPWIPPSQHAVLTESVVQEQEKRRRTSLVPPGMEGSGVQVGGTNSTPVGETPGQRRSGIPETIPEVESASAFRLPSNAPAKAVSTWSR